MGFDKFKTATAYFHDSSSILSNLGLVIALKEESSDHTLQTSFSRGRH